MGKLRAFALTAALILGVASGVALAVDDPTPPANPDHEAGKTAVRMKDWKAAIQFLTAAEKRDSGNADIQNPLGYAYRNSGNLDLAFKYYARALQLNPRHLGAHEYVGEAYLMAGNPAKAQEHLAALKRFCSRNCVERDELEKGIAEYHRRAATAK
jgi:Flp pilus assembly protein TadD